MAFTAKDRQNLIDLMVQVGRLDQAVNNGLRHDIQEMKDHCLRQTSACENKFQSMEKSISDSSAKKMDDMEKQISDNRRKLFLILVILTAIVGGTSELIDYLNNVM